MIDNTVAFDDISTEVDAETGEAMNVDFSLLDDDDDRLSKIKTKYYHLNIKLLGMLFYHFQMVSMLHKTKSKTFLTARCYIAATSFYPSRVIFKPEQ